MSTSFERREHQRHKFFDTVNIEYSLSPLDVETFKGSVVDMSDSGMFILTSRLLVAGQEIIVRTEIGAPSQIARVAWVEEEEKGEYKIGLIFEK